MEQKIYLEIYKKANENAIGLQNEAKLLIDNSHFARGYALAFTALEEISKGQFAADVYTGLKDEKEFKDFYRNHIKKAERMKWAQNDANTPLYNLKHIGPEFDDYENMSPEEPTFQKRQAAFYLDIDFSASSLLIPKDEISEKDANDMLHIVNVALERIWESVEHWGHPIGTKGFMK